MVKIRKLDWLNDENALSGFDASFSTNSIYRVIRRGLSFELVEERLEAPFQKTYSFKDIAGDIQDADFAVVAETKQNNEIAGFATVKYESWNRRAVLTGIFVSPSDRKQGIGQALLNAALIYAKTTRARCLWAETQNVNYAAVEFYTNFGFELCGLDVSLYDPAELRADEAALFFARRITKACNL